MLDKLKISVSRLLATPVATNECKYVVQMLSHLVFVNYLVFVNSIAVQNVVDHSGKWELGLLCFDDLTTTSMAFPAVE